MAKTKISVSLVKKGIPINHVIKQGIPYLELNNELKLYYKNNQPVSPKWVNSFLKGEFVGNEALQGKSVAAVILYQIDVGEGVNRIFAVCFGFGRALLESNVVEKRFGLLVTLNSIDADKLRSLDINSMEAVPLNNRIQSSALAAISNFNIDVDKDLLKSVTGKATGEELKGTMSGADSLSVSTDKNYDEMDEFLLNCYRLFKSTHYKETGFDWINQMQGIKDKNDIDRLDVALVTALNSEEHDHVWTSIPEIIDYNLLDSFRLRSDTIYDDLSIDILQEEFDKEFTIKNLKRRKVECLNAEGVHVKTWPVYRCLYADIVINGHQYLLNDGKWYEVDLNYVRQVQEYYNNADLADLPLLDYQWVEEGVYNKKVCESNPALFCLMDKKNIILDGQSPIEFCDIYTRNRQFIHVKNYKSSSVLSHLFFQGFVSADNFSNLEYRRKANEKLRDGFQVPEELDVRRSDYEVVFAIAKSNIETGERPDIPFFSKVSFRSVARSSKKYGFKVSIIGIKRYEHLIKEGGNVQ